MIYMGRIFIKEEDGKEVAYEEGAFGIETKIGELHENWDGSKETRNFFGPHVTIEKECDNVFEPFNFNKYDREGSVDGENGSFNKNTIFGYETENSPSFKPNQSDRSIDRIVEVSSGSSGNNYNTLSYSNSSGNSKKSSFFRNLGLLYVAAVIAYISFSHYLSNINKNNECKPCDNYYNNLQIDYNESKRTFYKIHTLKYAEFYKRLDSNKDGKINKEEFDNMKMGDYVWAISHYNGDEYEQFIKEYQEIQQFLVN